MDSWRGAVNGVLYRVQFQRDLNDEVAARVAADLLAEDPQGQYAALMTAVRSGQSLTDLIPQAHSEADFRDFVLRVLSRMDAMRPWPEPPLRRLDEGAWVYFAQTRPVARLSLDSFELQRRAHQIFDTIEAEDAELEVLILRLRSGAETALVEGLWGDSSDVAVLKRDPALPTHQLLNELVPAIGVQPTEVTVLG